MHKFILALFFGFILFFTLSQPTHAACYLPTDGGCTNYDVCPANLGGYPAGFTNQQSCEDYKNNPSRLNPSSSNPIPAANIITPAPASNNNGSNQPATNPNPPATSPGSRLNPADCPADPGDGSGYTLCPPLEDINDTISTVLVTFNNSDLPDDVFVCLESDFCIDDGGIRNGIKEGDQAVFEAASFGLSLDDVDEATIQRYKLVDGKIEVCGDGDKKLKAIGEDGDASNHPHYAGKDNNNWWSKMKNDDKAGCIPERDYFHPGKSYTLAVYAKQPKEDNDDGKEKWALLDLAGFYINHKFPGIHFAPPANFRLNDAKFEVSLTSDFTKPNGNKDNKEYRNNYQVQFQGPGYSENRCGYLMGSKDTTERQTVVFDPPDNALRPGKFRILIKDQASEDPNLYQYMDPENLRFIDNLLEKANEVTEDYGYPIGPEALCRGGFTYRVYNCSIYRLDEKVDGEERFSSACELTTIKNPDYNPNDKNSKRTIQVNYIDDPNKVDVRGLLAYFDLLGEKAADSSYPCNIGGAVQNDPSGCKAVDTAIGKIPVDPVGFIARAFSIVLSIAGIGAIFVIIYAGYRMLLSRGNPEMIKAARESLTSAVIGLLFIIFSLVILSIIANDILKIPGFEDDAPAEKANTPIPE